MFRRTEVVDTVRRDNQDRQNAARHYEIVGRVQGVGFRPFVYRLATRLLLVGRVWNTDGRVIIQAQGSPAGLAIFERELVHAAPTNAQPRIAAARSIDTLSTTHFAILPSDAPEEGPTDSPERLRGKHPGNARGLDVSPMMGTPTPHIPLDTAICSDCLNEMNDPSDRRYRYPFTHCDRCGPRYSIMTALPYDRIRTSLNAFPLCPDCAAEYHDPENRRFHAQSISCPNCGPRLRYRSAGDEDTEDPAQALVATIAVLASGGIVAVRGVGGYHLMADATNDTAVDLLRQRKGRPDKPLAVMFPWQGADGLQALRPVTEMTDHDVRALHSPERPIVLLPLKDPHALSRAVAPGLKEVGILMPYTPLHHLIVSALNRPLIATSANFSGDPIITTPEDAEQRLRTMADGFLHHDRQIHHRVDDSIYRRMGDALRPLRLGRGKSPLEIELPWAIDQPILAVGGQQKNTLCMAWNRRLVLSPHIGDMDGFATQRSFERHVESLQEFYDVQAEIVVHDRHADYAATRWAKASGLPCHAVGHHAAHAAALCGEYRRFDEETLVFTWDGTGLGSDGTLWGGEALIGRPGAWQRHASIMPFALPGGEAAIRAPWRLAMSLCWASGIDWQPVGVSKDDVRLLRTIGERHPHSPATSSVGRLFDAGAALLGHVDTVSHEAQGPMRLEASAYGIGDPVNLPQQRHPDGVLRCDWRPLIRHLANNGIPAPQRAADFHTTLAHVVRFQARTARKAFAQHTVGLTGGVFQNRRLVEETINLLEADGFDVLLHTQIPCNDAGISYGQAMEAFIALRADRRRS